MRGRAPYWMGFIRAFSTMELMGAMFIGVLLSVMAVTSYQLYEREMPAQFAARRLTHAFATARAYAVAHESVFAVQLDRTHKNFWIDETDEAGGALAPKIVPPERIDDKVAIGDVYFGAGLVPTTTEILTIRFFADGSCDDMRVFLRMAGTDANDSKNIFTVRLYGPTGQSRVFDRQPLLP